MEENSPQKLLEKLEEWRIANKLSRPETARQLGIPYKTFQKWFGEKRRLPIKGHLEKIESFLDSPSPAPELDLPEAESRTEAIKHLLIALEIELRHFRNAGKAEREVFRKLLNQEDIGYISSLLSMLGDENRFKRWLTLSNYRFQGFKKGGQK